MIHITSKKRTLLKDLQKDFRVNYQLYLCVLAPMLLVFIFQYIPMYGVIIAFKRYSFAKGILGSSWVGLKYFERFFASPMFWKVLRNTLEISIYSLVAGFPIPIILALALNAARGRGLKKVVQMVSYAPYFISVVVMVGLLLQLLSPRTGIINLLLNQLGFDSISFLGEPQLFSSVYVWSNIWQNMGWGSIIYLATLSKTDPSLNEAAIIDGASRFQRVLYIDIPVIIPTTVILLILSVGRIMSVGFEKVLLMQNSLNTERSEIIATYVYKVSLASGAPQFSYAAAVGLFNALINFILIIVVNRIAKRISETSLW